MVKGWAMGVSTLFARRRASWGGRHKASASKSRVLLRDGGREGCAGADGLGVDMGAEAAGVEGADAADV